MLKELPLAGVEPPLRKPEWMKIRLSQNKQFHGVHGLIRDLNLHTVCQEAACPNQGECWSRGTATFMILGDTCTRSCGFCNVKTGRPLSVDHDEPQRVAEAVAQMNLKYTVITSVNRDELPDGGVRIFAETIERVRESSPQCRIEVLIPDFKGSERDLRTVCEAKPAVLAHNVETVARLYLDVRPQAKYWRSLLLLARAKKMKMVTKSGIMVGLGETREDVIHLLRDLADAGCDLMTIGQYLQPTPRHLPVKQYIHPDLFRDYHQIGMELGFKHVESGPLVRSSYHAETQEALMRSEVV
jgi:lipoic acid synthetase